MCRQSLLDVLQDLSCSDYATLVASYHGSAAAGANCSSNLKRLAVAQQKYDVPFAPSSLVMNDPAFIGAQSQRGRKRLLKNDLNTRPWLRCQR
jgi:hypothetical protein